MRKYTVTALVLGVLLLLILFDVGGSATWLWRLLILGTVVGGIFLVADRKRKKGVPFLLTPGREFLHRVVQTRADRMRADRGEITETEYERLKSEHMRKFGFSDDNA